MRQIHAAHKRKNAPSIRAKRSSYLKATRAKQNARAKKWRDANPDKLKQYRANRKAKCPNHGTLSMNKRRALQNKAPIGDLKAIARWMAAWKSKRFAVCFWCGSKQRSRDCQADHIVPLSKGGSHAIGNLCVSCPTCNHRKNNRTLANWNGLLTSPVLL